MHAVLFQFRPHADQRGTYFDLVALLRPELQRIEGFLANERFALPDDPGDLLSLSLWRDEAAILRWRAHAGHRLAQLRGKREVLASYRLRVGAEIENHGGASLLRLTIGSELVDPAGGAQLYRGILDPARQLILGPATGAVERRLALQVIRDYGSAAASGTFAP